MAHNEIVDPENEARLKRLADGIGSFVIGELERREFIGQRQPNGDMRLIAGSLDWMKAHRLREAIEAEALHYLKAASQQQIKTTV